jgi:hypothetical protein
MRMRTLCYGLTVVASLLVVVLLLVFRPWVRAIHPIENTDPTDSVDLHIRQLATPEGQSQPEKAVTDEEKKEFLKLLATLPTRGEFFAKEAIPKAAPHTRVLLALTEKDLEKYDHWRSRGPREALPKPVSHAWPDTPWTSTLAGLMSLWIRPRPCSRPNAADRPTARRKNGVTIMISRKPCP